jgi:hypothetical protein
MITIMAMTTGMGIMAIIMVITGTITVITAIVTGRPAMTAHLL